MNSRGFKLYRAYSISFNSSNVDFFCSGVEFWKTASKFRKRERKSSSCVHVLHKTWHQVFSRRSRAVTAKKCTKKPDARAELLFCQEWKPIDFCRSHWRRRRRLQNQSLISWTDAIQLTLTLKMTTALGCRNVSHCQHQQLYSGLRSPGRSYSIKVLISHYVKKFKVNRQKPSYYKT